MNQYSKVFFFLGMTICFLSIVTATILYNSFGYTTVEKAIYSAFGFVLAITGIILLTASGFLAQKGSLFLSFIAFIGWLIAISFAITSHIGFMASAQLHSQQNSEQSVANKERAGELTRQIEANASLLAVDVGKLKNDLAHKQSELSNAQQALSSCPRTYVTVCIKPSQAKVASISKEIATIESQLNEVARIEGLQKLKGDLTATSSVSSLDKMPAHVLFHMLAHYFGGTAQTIMAWFLLISSIFLEFLGSFFLLLSRKFSEPDYATAAAHSTTLSQPVVTAVRQPQLTTKEESVEQLPSQWSYPTLSSFVGKKA